LSRTTGKSRHDEPRAAFYHEREMGLQRAGLADYLTIRYTVVQGFCRSGGISMSITIQVAQRGVFTLPKALRDAYQITAGDMFTVIDLGDGNILLRRGHSQVDELLEGIRSDLEASGESLETMLARLRAQREGRLDD
jgi:bifunctional DNA-binding transcriptional regulator/antitoxin component of YhaV-PrlF toxin-antitoxin module